MGWSSQIFESGRDQPLIMGIQAQKKVHVRKEGWDKGTLGISFGGSWDPEDSDYPRGPGLKGSPEVWVSYQICRVEFQALPEAGQCGGGTWRLLSMPGLRAKIDHPRTEVGGIHMVGLKEFGGGSGRPR